MKQKTSIRGAEINLSLSFNLEKIFLLLSIQLPEQHIYFCVQNRKQLAQILVILSENFDSLNYEILMILIEQGVVQRVYLRDEAGSNYDFGANKELWKKFLKDTESFSANALWDYIRKFGYHELLPEK